MKIVSKLRYKFSFSAYRCATGGGRIERIEIPLLHALAELPGTDLEALLILSDLQCFDRKAGPPKDRELLAATVGREIWALAEAGLVPSTARIGVLLAGDFYADPSLLKRGGQGDVDWIWEALGRDFRWVAGVAGNHDLFGGQAAFPASFKRAGSLFPLHGNVIQIDGLIIGGVSGIPGYTDRPWRYTDPEFESRFLDVLAEKPDVVVLHQGPESPDGSTRGYFPVNQMLECVEKKPLVIFGHRQWPEVVTDRDGLVLLSVEGRVVLLTKNPAGL